MLNLASSEVRIQYRQGEQLKATSVLIVTWENVAPVNAHDNLDNDVSRVVVDVLWMKSSGDQRCSVLLKKTGIQVPNRFFGTLISNDFAETQHLPTGAHQHQQRHVRTFRLQQAAVER